MSALQQLLAQHSQEIEARIQHQNDVDNEVSERKAQTLEEKFQHAKDAIESVGAELGAAGTAFHVGRKVYTKYKARQARLAKEQAQKKPGADSETTDTDTATFKARPDEPQVTRTEPEIRTDEPAPEPTVRQPAAEQPSLETIAEDPAELPSGQVLEKPSPPSRISPSEQVREAPRPPPSRQAQAQAAEEAQHPDSVTEPKATETQPAQDLGDAGTAEGQEARAANVENAQATESAGTEAENPLATRAATPLQSSGSEPVTHPTSEANINSPNEANSAPEGNAPEPATLERPSGLSPQDVEEGARAFMNPETGEARAAANIASRSADGSSIIDKGINGAKKVAGQVGKGLEGDASEGISSALPEIGEALDFLGPLGEVAGLITGLVGLFEGLGHKPEEPKAITQPGQVALQSAGGGIDPKALLADQPKGGLTAF